jgi:hypothetical protein
LRRKLVDIDCDVAGGAADEALVLVVKPVEVVVCRALSGA